MKHIVTKIYTLLIVLFAIGCTTDTDNSGSDIGVSKEAKVSLSVKLPLSFTQFTRAVSVSAIKNDPLVLLMAEGKFVDFAEVDRKSDTEFDVHLNYKQVRAVDQFIFIANSNLNVEDSNYYMPEEGDTYEQITQSYLFRAPIDIEAEGIPMWGETQYDKTKKNVSINLERAVAMINVTMEESLKDFKLDNVYICNFNKYGYLSDDALLGDYDVVKVESSKAYSAERGVVSNQIFVAPVVQDKLESDELPVVLVLEGVYNGVQGFYRVDFLKTGKDKDEEKTYFSLERNYKYECTIKSVHGYGWLHLDQAVNNKPSNVVDYDIIPWHGDVLDMWEQDGKYLALGDRNLTFNPMTSKYNPERLICQTNLDADVFKFVSENDVFVLEATRDDAKGLVYLDFYLNEDIDINTIKDEPQRGVLEVNNAAFKYDLTFTYKTNYLKVYDFDVDLYGRYTTGVEVDPNTEYMNMKVEYETENIVLLKIHATPKNSDDFYFEGYVLMDPADNFVETTIRAYGTPTWKGNETFTVDFSELHPDSPISKVDIDVYALHKQESRKTKILFVTENGSDNDAIYQAVNDMSYFGTEGRSIKMEGGLDIYYATEFPFTKYMDYHIIYYFDSSSPVIDDGEDKSVEMNKKYLQLLDAAKEMRDAGKYFFYCSDRRVVKDNSWSLDPNKYVDVKELDDLVLEESRLFLSEVYDINHEINLRSIKGSIKGGLFESSYLQNENIYNDLTSSDPLMTLGYYKTADGGKGSGSNSVDLPSLVLEKDANKNDFDILYYVVNTTGLSVVNRYTRHPVVLKHKGGNVVWIGNSRIFYILEKRSIGTVEVASYGPSGKEFVKLIKDAVLFTDKNDVNFNKPNKKKKYEVYNGGNVDPNSGNHFALKFSYN